MENIKINDTICIITTHIDPEKYYYGGKRHGVVIEKNQNEITIVKADGEQETFDLSKKDTEYTYTFGEFSEFEYIKQIEKTISEQKNRILRETERLEDIEKWLKTFKYDISFLGRLSKFLKKI